MLQLVIFDMDGTMFDTERTSFDTWKLAIEKYGYEMDFTFFKTLIGGNYEKAEELCLKHYGKDFPFAPIMEHKRKYTDAIVAKEGIKIKPGLLELIDFLDEAKISMAVATSSGRERTEEFLDSAGILHRFDYVLCGDEVKKSKPDPEIFINTAKRLHADFQDTVVLEDSLAGIAAAFAGGMKPVMVPDLVEPDEATKQKAFRIFTSLLEVRDFLKANLHTQVL